MDARVSFLLVDDMQNNNLYIKALLQEHFNNIEIVTATSGEEALQYVENQSFDMIILDIQMPQMDGFEVAKRIKKSQRNDQTAIIFLTAHFVEESFKQQGFQVGAIDYMIKPLDSIQFINRIRLYTELFKRDNALRIANLEAQASLDMINRYIISSKTDLKGIITEATDAFCDISGYTREELVGSAHSIVRHASNPPSMYKTLWETIKNGQSWSGEILNRKKDGSNYWVYAVISPFKDIDGKTVGYLSMRQDITMKKQAEKEHTELMRSRIRLEEEKTMRERVETEAQEILNASENLIMIIENEHPHFANDALLEFLHVDSLVDLELTCGTLQDCFIENKESFTIPSGASIREWCKLLEETESRKRMVKMRSRTDNSIRIFDIKLQVLDDVRNRYLLILSDITSLEKSRKYYEHMATHDQLTGLYNRLYFNEALTQEIARARRYEDGFSIILLDIDHFKHINDTYGHLVGDEVLKLIADTLKQHLRLSDVCARWGGEEFMVLLPYTASKQAVHIAENLRNSFQACKHAKAKKITASFGVSTFTPDMEIEMLIKSADDALYEAKNSGRNRVCVASI